MATTTTLLSINEYLKTVYRPDCDFVDGELEERNVGEHDHNRIQMLLGVWFYSHEKEWNFEVIPEQRTRVSKSRVRIPEVSLVSRDISIEQVTVTRSYFALRSFLQMIASLE